MFGAIKVEGLRELQRSFALISNDLRRDTRTQLQEAAEPARSRAEDLAVSNIRNIGGRWSRMRLGVMATAIYLAPSTRRGGGSPRPNLGPLLMNRSMLPAAEETLPVIRERLRTWLDELGTEAGF